MLQHRDDSTTNPAEGNPLSSVSARAHANPLPAAVLALLNPWRLVLDQLLLMAEPLCTPLQRETLRRHRTLLNHAPGQPAGHMPSPSPAHDRQRHNPPPKGTL